VTRNISSDQRELLRKEVSKHLLYLQDEQVSGLELPVRDPPEQLSSSGNTIEENTRALKTLQARLGKCTRCKLHEARHNIVFGEGSSKPDLVFVGEGPGRDEDMQGKPFVGRAGVLLNKILAAVGLKREDVYICNIVKCRPPNNRNPEPDEIAICSPFLKAQLDILRPKLICTLGNVATAFIIGKKAPMSVVRGRFYDYRGICVRPTYHPAAILRNPAYRRPVWNDVKDIMKYIGKDIE
jgi:uracil-DNA glycosylase